MKQNVFILPFVGVLMFSSEAVSDGESIEGEIQDLVEMVPFEKVMALGMEYAITDPQVKHFLHYLTSQPFKSNLVNLEASSQFECAAEVAKRYNVSLYSLANRVNHALDIPLIKANRTRRSPGDGILSFVQDVLEMTPIDDMKDVYRYKVDKNPVFKDFMDHMLSGQAREFMNSLASSKPFQDTRRDLLQIGVPVDELVRFITDRLTLLFDLTDHQTSSTTPIYYEDE